MGNRLKDLRNLTGRQLQTLQTLQTPQTPQQFKSMNRRSFFKLGSMAAFFAGLPSLKAMPDITEKPRLIKPRRLQPGATVAVIAPSSPPRAEKLNKGLENLRSFGFNLVEGKSLRAQNGHLAGTDAERLADLHWAFQDPAIDAVWCIRGGYGAGRLLPMID